MRGKAVNSRNVNSNASLRDLVMSLSTEKVIEIMARPDYPCHFFFLEGHSADFQRRFLDALKGNEPTAEPKHDDFCIRYPCFILTHKPPVLSRCIRQHE